MAVAPSDSNASGVARTLARRGPDIIPRQSIPISAVSDQPIDDTPRPPVSASAHPDDQASGVSREISAEELALGEAARRPTGVAPTSESAADKKANGDADDTTVDTPTGDDADDGNIDSDRLDASLPGWAKREITKTRNAARKARSEAAAAAEAAKAEAAAAAKRAEDSVAEAEALRKQIAELEAKKEADPEPQPEPRPTRDQFDDPDAYDDALTTWAKNETARELAAEQRKRDAEAAAAAKAEKDQADRKAAEETEQKRQDDIARVEADWQAQLDTAKEKYADFDEVALAAPDENGVGGPTVSQPMAAAIMQVANGADVLYFLGQNTDESVRIANMANPVRQFIEIGRISQRLETPPARRALPRPIVPLDANRNGSGDNQPDAEPDMATYFENRTAKLAGNRRPFFPPGGLH